MRGRAVVAWLVSGWLGVLSAGPVLPVYIEENHAGSFYFLAQELELERECTLVLIDAHSDASAAAESDRVRRELRRVGSPGERGERLAAWRRAGRIQANAWLEPLMPRPVARVLWVSEENGEEKQGEARRFLDGRLEGEPRDCGSLEERFSVVGWGALRAELGRERPVLVSLDLDAFSGLAPGRVESELSRVIARILSLPRLSAVTVALSRPWLADDAEAERLLRTVVREFCGVRNARVRFEPFATCGPDRTRLAREGMAEGKLPPRFLVEHSGEELRKELLRCRNRLEVRVEAERWERLLDRWEGAEAGWFLEVDGAQRSTDGAVRVDRNTPAALRIRGGSGGRVTGVRWFQRKPERDCYNVLPQVPAGKSFAGVAGAWIRSVDVPVAETNEAALASKTWKKLAAGGLGVIRLWAEVSTAEGRGTTPELEIRLTDGEGFHAGLSEQFGLPYIFGAGFLRAGGCSGPETGWGSDCANFLVHAWRRTGRRLPWCSPGQLRRHLVPLAGFRTGADGVRLPAGSVARGVVVHLGNHVAALWRDVEPIGILTGADEVAHHLGGVPEVVVLDALMRAKERETVEVLMVPEPREVFSVAFGGDVNLAGMGGGGQEVVATLPAALTTADRSVVNLECGLGETGTPVDKRYCFRAPGAQAAMLSRAGIDAVSVANNHAGDFGEAGLLETLREVEAAGLIPIGAGEDLDAALRPAILSGGGVSVAVLGASLVKPARPAAASDRIGVVCLPEHEEDLRKMLKSLTEEGHVVLVFLHWGDEYTGRLTETQRNWARSLIDGGAAAVVGAHSHHPQMTDTWKGRPIVYSLGNLVFPGEGPNAGFQRAAVARFAFGEGGRLVAWRVTQHAKSP